MTLFDFSSFGSSTPSEGEQQRFLFPRQELSQQVIDEAMCIGANDQNSRLIICAYFKKDKPLEDNAQFRWNTMVKMVLAFIWIAGSIPFGTMPKASMWQRVKLHSAQRPL